jgi:hypothetical protein
MVVPDCGDSLPVSSPPQAMSVRTAFQKAALPQSAVRHCSFNGKAQGTTHPLCTVVLPDRCAPRLPNHAKHGRSNFIWSSWATSGPKALRPPAPERRAGCAGESLLLPSEQGNADHTSSHVSTATIRRCARPKSSLAFARPFCYRYIRSVVPIGVPTQSGAFAMQKHPRLPKEPSFSRQPFVRYFCSVPGVLTKMTKVTRFQWRLSSSA